MDADRNRSRGPLSLQVPVPEAVDQVIIHHPGCLHKGVADGSSCKFEPAFSHVVMNRDSPLFIMVPDHQRIVPRPLTGV